MNHLDDVDIDKRNSELKTKGSQMNENGIKEKPVEMDYLSKCIGSFGLWQALCCAIVSGARFIAVWNLLNIVFLTPNTNFTCMRREVNETHDSEENICYNDCVEYNYTSSVFESTIVTDFGLVCEKSWLASFAQSAMMFGVLIGSFISGWVSDRFGRRFAMWLSIYPCVLLMIAASFSPKFYVLISLRVLIGIFSSGLFILSTLYYVELIGINDRNLATAFIILPDALSTASLAIFAYFTNTWQVYSFAISIVSLVISIPTLFLPETPRWLMCTGRDEEAIELIKRAAQFNKMETENIDNIMIPYVAEAKEMAREEHANMLELVKTKSLVFRLVCLLLLATSCDTLYFGITQFVSHIGPNVYIDIAIIGLVQILSVLLGMVVNKYLTRKVALSACFIITGVVMLALAFVPKGSCMITLLGVTGVVTITLALLTLYVFISEQFPTNLRSMALGVCSGGSKLGNMAAPFIATLSPQWLPSIIFAAIPILSIIPCVFVPETKGKELKDYDSK